MRAFKGIEQSRAGAMESLTVVILAVAAIVIAAMVWAFLSSSIGMQQTSADFVVQSAEVRVIGGNMCILSLVLRNTGGQQFNQIKVEIRGSGGLVQTIGPLTIPPLNPGQTWSSPSDPPFRWGCTGWSPGTSILIMIELTTPFPSSVTIRKNVNSLVQFGA
jgi:hypothetical protein